MAQDPILRSGQTNSRPLSQGGATALPADVSGVLRNTYLLLGLTLAFASVVAFTTMSLGMGRVGFIPMLIGFFGLLFLVEKTADSAWGILSAFLFTGFLGATLGPILSMYLQLPNGGTLIGSALATASFAFVGLSGYALVTRKDFSFLSGFLMVGFFVLMGAVLCSWAFNLSGLHTAISAGFVLFSSAAILYQTGAIVNGGERNYIRATTSLFVSFYNLFLSLLQIFGIMGDD